MREKFLDEKGLVPEEKWAGYVDSLCEKTPQFVKSKKEAVEILSKAIENAMKKRIPKEKFGIFFSGGVDSTLIAFLSKKFRGNFICYSAGIKGSKDLQWAAEIADALGFPIKHREFTIEESEKLIRKAVSLVGPNIVKAGVATVVLAAHSLAKDDNLSIFFTGLGTEEIFAGYERHANAKDVHQECWAGLKTMWKRDLTRDVLLAQKLGFDARTPFLDEEVIIAAMRASPKMKIDDEQKKIILREVAVHFGLPEKYAWRKKIAAQYGSGFDKAIAKLTKKYGYEKKGDWLEAVKSGRL